MAELHTGGVVTSRSVWPVEGCVRPLSPHTGVDLVAVTVTPCDDAADAVRRIHEAISRPPRAPDEADISLDRTRPDIAPPLLSGGEIQDIRGQQGGHHEGS